jgi:uncharacterized membrane protein
MFHGALGLTILGVLFAASGFPLMQRWVPPNHVYGFRTPATLRDEDKWYRSNEVAGRIVFGIGIALLVGALVLTIRRS